MGFPKQECWSRLPFPSPGNLPGAVIIFLVQMGLMQGAGAGKTLTTWAQTSLPTY